MSTAKHTQGPWEISHEFNVYGGKRLVATTGGHSNNTDDDGGYAENKANARLVASAPDLLNALKKMVAVFDGYRDVEPKDEEGQAKEFACALAAATINQAEGLS